MLEPSQAAAEVELQQRLLQSHAVSETQMPLALQPAPAAYPQVSPELQSAGLVHGVPVRHVPMEVKGTGAKPSGKIAPQPPAQWTSLPSHPQASTMLMAPHGSGPIGLLQTPVRQRWLSHPQASAAEKAHLVPEAQSESEVQAPVPASPASSGAIGVPGPASA